MAGWIVRRPDDDETKKKSQQPLATVKQEYNKAFLQALHPAGTTKTANPLEQAKKTIATQKLAKLTPQQFGVGFQQPQQIPQNPYKKVSASLPYYSASSQGIKTNTDYVTKNLPLYVQSNAPSSAYKQMASDLQAQLEQNRTKTRQENPPVPDTLKATATVPTARDNRVGVMPYYTPAAETKKAVEQKQSNDALKADIAQAQNAGYYLDYSEQWDALNNCPDADTVKNQLARMATLKSSLGSDYGQNVAAMTEYQRIRLELNKLGINAEGLADWLQRNANVYEAQTEQEKAVAESNGFWGGVASSAKTIPMVLEGGTGIIAAGVQNAMNNRSGEYRPVDIYGNAFDASRYRSTVRGNVGGNIAEWATNATGSEVVGDVAKFLYETSMSGGDSAFMAVLGGLGMAGGAAGAGNAVSLILGSNAASETVMDVVNRGGSTQQAFYSGLLAGAAESFFEKYSIEGLISKAKSGGNVLKNAILQGVTEGSEEMATELTNILSDQAIMGDLSNAAYLKREYMAQGMSEEDAEKMVKGQLALQVGQAGIGGALMGVVGGSVSTVNRNRSIGNVTAAEMAGALTEGAAPGWLKSRAETPRISAEDFANSQSPVWHNVDYADKGSQAKITTELSQKMRSEGKVVSITQEDLNALDKYYPDLRTLKKKERLPLMKKSIAELKDYLRGVLSSFKDSSIDFTVNGNILETRLYNTGINEVLEKVSQDKAAMLEKSKEIFANAEYLYSTGDKNNDPNIYRWNYFYVPLDVNGEQVGVRIAVRDMAKQNESQLYNWGIKKGTNTAVDGDAKSASPSATSVVPTQTIAQTTGEVNTQSGDRQSWLTWDWAARLKRRRGLGMDTESLRTELDEIYRDVDRNGWTEENTERLDKLARQLVDSEKGTVNQDRTQQIKDAKAYLRKITLPVTPDMKAELESRFGDWKTFTSKLRNRIHFRLVDGKTKLQGIDTHYSQLNELCPEWFPEGIENATDYDIMAHVVNFVENANEVRDYALNQDYDAAVEEIAGELRNGYDEIHQTLEASGEVDATLYAPEMDDRNASAANAPTETAAMLRDDTGEGGLLASARGNLEDVAEQIDGNGSYMNLDISRVLDKVAGKNKKLRQRLYEAVEKPLAEAKTKYARSVIGRLKSYKAAMDRLGIKAGSKESAAVQWYGEGQRQTGVDGETRPYSLEQLQREFPDTWQNIVEAEKIHRLIYNEYVERINKALSMIFPNVEARAAEDLQILKEKADEALARAQEQQALVTALVQRGEELRAQLQSGNLVEASKARQELTKLPRRIAEETNRTESRNKAAQDAVQAYTDMAAKIEDGSYFTGKRLRPRKDYFHHFVEMEQGIGGLVNILNRPSDIATELVGVSDNTKPKTKWWGALQRRTGAAYTEDAVGGMARYIPAAEYKISIDPFIAQMRGTIKSLVDGSAAYKNANGFIEFLTHWTNDLAGKTNPLDRGVQTAVGRKTMKVLEWVNNRVKANAVVGNLGSAIVQIGNIPNATTYVQNPVYWIKAAATMANTEKARTLLAQSPFLTERYMGSTTGMFDQKNALQKGAEWVLEIGDQKASELIWLAAYNQYEEAGGNVKGPRQYENAVDYADDVTRRSVAGRGVGELPLTQRSRVVKLFAPFQVEVNNTYNLMKEQLGAKNAKGLVAYCASAWLTNALIEAVANKRPLFDPIDALIDAIKAAIGDEEEEGSAGEAAQRLLGEAVANIPYATALAPMFFDTDDLEKVFGEQDPTRYGTGLSATADLMAQAGNLLNDKPVDWLGLATTYVTPYGGQQLERIVKAGQNFGYLPDLTKTEEGTQLKRREVPGSYNDAGKLRFAMEPNLKNIATAAAFGEYATPEGREYIQSGNMPLSEKNTGIVTEAVKKGMNANTVTWIIRNKGTTQAEATKAIKQALGLTKQQKAWLWKEVTGGADKNNPFK